jgi:glycolate oxidase
VAAYGRLQPAFYLHDCVIPRSELSSILARIQAIGQEFDVTIGNVFHAGDGNLHPNVLFDPDDPAMVERTLKAGEAILQACLDVGGTLSGEHGIGIEKSAFMPRQFTAADLAQMERLKQALDPSGLANPGKIFPVRAGCGETRHKAVMHPLLANGTAWI